MVGPLKYGGPVHFCGGIVIEIRFHGRGGQGAVIASELLAQAVFLEGKFPQSFPFFGVERRGAPVTAFTRIDDRPILVRTTVTSPDIVVVLDEGLMHAVPVTAGLKQDGLLVVNTGRPPEELSGTAARRLATIDATKIAIAHGLGTRSVPIVNTALLGALARASGVVGLNALREAIAKFVPAKPQENIAAAEDAYDAVRIATR